MDRKKNIGGCMSPNPMENKRAQFIGKIMGVGLSLTGILLVVKYHLHFVGIILTVFGIYFAFLLGTKDLQ